MGSRKADGGRTFGPQDMVVLADARGGPLPYVVLDKPAGLAVIPGRAEATCLLELAGQHLNIAHAGTTDPRLRIVHRIDKETSGVVTMACSIEAQRALSAEFLAHRVGKTYLAIVHGHLPAAEGTIDAPLGPHPKDPKRRAIVTGNGGRPALTHYRVLQRFRHYSFLELHPKTGKTHQLRVHLASVGTPIVLDRLYGRTARASGGGSVGGGGDGEGILLSQLKRGYRPVAGQVERPLLTRLALHAHRLAILGDTFESPLPKDMANTVRQMGKWG